MRPWKLPVRSPALLGILLTLCAGTARSQSGTCTPITAVPAVITSPGVYCLTGNLTHTTIHAPAIAVNSSSVVIDFNGYRLFWQGGGLSSGNPAVSLGSGYENITIRNGLISGFTLGVEVFAEGVIIEDMRFHNNALGIATRQGTAGGAIIRRNSIRLGNGIEVGSNSARLVDNDIYGPERSDAVGYNGISILGQNAIVVGNRLGRLYSGIWFDLRIPGSGKYGDNITTNVTIPYTGGTSIGNND